MNSYIWLLTLHSCLGVNLIESAHVTTYQSHSLVKASHCCSLLLWLAMYFQQHDRNFNINSTLIVYKFVIIIVLRCVVDYGLNFLLEWGTIGTGWNVHCKLWTEFFTGIYMDKQTRGQTVSNSYPNKNVMLVVIYRLTRYICHSLCEISRYTDHTNSYSQLASLCLWWCMHI